MKTAKPIVFLDFDGTITRRDVTDAILEACADPAWQAIEDEWQAGKIGSRECLSRQMALVDASPADVDALIDGIEIDPGLVALFDAASAAGIAVHIVSEGFDYCIQRVLRRPSLNLARYLGSVEIVSAHLEPRGRAWHVSFPVAPCTHGCGTCKPVTIDRLAPKGAQIIFVGDGLSDRHAAGHADVVFAKQKLATYCEAQGIEFTPYATLVTVARWLTQTVRNDTRMSSTI